MYGVPMLPLPPPGIAADAVGGRRGGGRGNKEGRGQEEEEEANYYSWSKVQGEGIHMSMCGTTTVVNDQILCCFFPSGEASLFLAIGRRRERDKKWA